MNEIIKTLPEKCAGCNKCISECKIHANSASIEEYGHPVVAIADSRCIDCGACLKVCDHEARDFSDDTERFFNDLSSGVSISLLVAPAVRYNFRQYKQLFGFLKSRGVNLIYDVSYGADICTWAYLKAIKDWGITTMISQPCPVIVSYIETRKPELASKLAPIHSPTLCAAVYLKKYQNVSDKLAFLSPCIAKANEFRDPNTDGLVEYNVTYEKLKKYLEENGISLQSFPSKEFDQPDGAMGMVFSRPGGLKENVRFYAGDNVWVKQIEGLPKLIEYFDEYERRIATQKPLPLLVDALNCENGCNFGTATINELDIDDVDYATTAEKKTVDRKKADALFNYFDTTFELEDFRRVYSPHVGNDIIGMPLDIEPVFQKLGKLTPESRKINCHACGHGNCVTFARAVASGHNVVENCINYARHELSENLNKFDDLFDSLHSRIEQTDADLLNLKRSSSALQSIATQTKIISLNASIEAAHAQAAGASFAVVAGEMRKLANKSSDVIEGTNTNTANIAESVSELKVALAEVKKRMHKVSVK